MTPLPDRLNTGSRRKHSSRRAQSGLISSFTASLPSFCQAGLSSSQSGSCSVAPAATGLAFSSADCLAALLSPPSSLDSSCAKCALAQPLTASSTNLYVCRINAQASCTRHADPVPGQQDSTSMRSYACTHKPSRQSHRGGQPQSATSSDTSKPTQARPQAMQAHLR